mmetsp:Transcript_52950/g.141508  ORF Transcript_52950/g.141508 Transcript_52950/m.141508 type:complete len:227 (-) Transcript_52950:2366-3046(-)
MITPLHTKFFATVTASEILETSGACPKPRSIFPPPFPPMASKTLLLHAPASMVLVKSLGTVASKEILPPEVVNNMRPLLVTFLLSACIAKLTTFAPSPSTPSTTATKVFPPFAASSDRPSPSSLHFFSKAFAASLPSLTWPIFKLSISLRMSVFMMIDTSLSSPSFWRKSAILRSRNAPDNVFASSTSTRSEFDFSVASTAACGPVTATIRLTPFEMPSSESKTTL